MGPDEEYITHGHPQPNLGATMYDETLPAVMREQISSVPNPSPTTLFGDWMHMQEGPAFFKGAMSTVSSSSEAGSGKRLSMRYEV